MRKFKSLLLSATNCDSQERVRVCYYGFVTRKDRRLSLQRTRMRRGIALSSRHFLRPFYRSFLLLNPMGRDIRSFGSYLIHLDPSRRTKSRGDRVWHCKHPPQIRGWFRRSFRHPSRVHQGTGLDHRLCLHSTHNSRRGTVRSQELRRPSLLVHSIHHRRIAQWMLAKLRHLSSRNTPSGCFRCLHRKVLQ